MPEYEEVNEKGVEMFKLFFAANFPNALNNLK
jgi:hypothetical protein